MNVTREADGGVEVDEADLASEGGWCRIGGRIEGCGAVGGQFVHVYWETEV